MVRVGLILRKRIMALLIFLLIINVKLSPIVKKNKKKNRNIQYKMKKIERNRKKPKSKNKKTFKIQAYPKKEIEVHFSEEITISSMYITIYLLFWVSIKSLNAVAGNRFFLLSFSFLLFLSFESGVEDKASICGGKERESVSAFFFHSSLFPFIFD
ncbi:uncharacterized protein PWA37_005379 [Arxiozyma heterogenica]|uniref:uncharacterized protein n=1 Tax=Arxiozyma heterogenica TaxID=278026 RepID=UPI002EFB4D0F